MKQAQAKKESTYRLLVEDRKACTLCADRLVNASRIDGGQYDSERIGPYSQWQGNLNAPLMVIAQDFSDVAGFRKYLGWAGSDIQTNITLRRLLACAGIGILAPEYGRPDDTLFFTNAVLCMKSGLQGGRQQNIPNRFFCNCSGFLRRTIEIVTPRLVITLGAGALKAVRLAFPGGNCEPLKDVVGRHMPLTKDVVLAPMYHPSPTVVNTTRSFPKMCEDWRGLQRPENDLELG